MQRFMKIGIAGVVLFLFAVIFGFILFPMVLKKQIHAQIALKEGSDMRGLWSKLPFPMEFRVYLFNVTNPNEIKNGEKPILKQVGPYFFEEWHEKTDLVDHEEDDTLDFRVKNRWIFKPEMSEGLTGDEELTLPHIFILAMVMTAYKEKPTMIPLINKAINSIFKNPSNVFLKMRAMDLMFDGLPIDCNLEDFPAIAVCDMLKDAEDLMQDGEKKYKFSLFGVKNDTAAKAKMRVFRGVKNLKDVGVVVEYDGKKNISKWNDDYCDTFNGTDGTIFHPFLYEKEDVVSFAPDLCRSLSLTFTEKTKVAGVKTNRYTTYLGDPNTIPSQKCFCEAPDKCLKKGVMDLYKCAGVPLIASHPHFYLADESYLNSVDGLNPSKDEHMLFLDFEPFSGSPLAAKKRLQFNIMIEKVTKFKVMKNFPEALLPLFWIEEGITLPDPIIAEIKSGQKIVTVVTSLVWIIIVVGLVTIGAAGYIYYRADKKLEITKVIETKIKSKFSNTEKETSIQETNPGPQIPTNID